MKGKEELPDFLRCKRTDGKSWRCRREVMRGMKLCEIHYLQGKHRQHKEKVPEELKLQRNTKKSQGKKGLGAGSLQIRVSKIDKSKKSRSMKLRRNNLANELVRMVVKREVEKRRKGGEGGDVGGGGEDDEDDDVVGDMMRRLPNGVMVISQPPPRRPGRDSGNGNCGKGIGSSCDVKVGVDDSVISTRRRFRSKNIEPLPVGAMQVLPYKRNVDSLRKGGRKRCHRCKSSDSSSLIKCSSCKKKFFCMECIKERYFETQEEVKMKCPVCRRMCSCEACLANRSQETGCQELSSEENKAHRISRCHYLICMLLPVLKQVNQEKDIELELEAKVRGMQVSEMHFPRSECSNIQYSCNNCKTSILDLHRRCSNCSYNLCLRCYWDICRGILPTGIEALKTKDSNTRKNLMSGLKRLSEKKSVKKLEESCGVGILSAFASLPNPKAYNSIGGISCPSKEVGGCGGGMLKLKCLFPLDWNKELESDAEEIACSYDFPENFDVSSSCPLCPGIEHKSMSEKLHQAATRNSSNDNFLYYPSSLEVRVDNREHFQKHWGRGHPVIVRNVLGKASNVSWDPLEMFCTYLENITSTKDHDEEAPKLCPSLEWCEVDISVKQLFMGSMRGQTHANMGNEMLKMRAWLSSQYFHKQFPAHFAEVLCALPLKDYMDPESGLLNLAAELQTKDISADIGPYVYISYSSSKDHIQAQSVSKLSCDLCDMVNVLVHATDHLITPEKLNRIKKLVRKRQAQDEELPGDLKDQISTNKDGEEPQHAANGNGLAETNGEEILLRKKIGKFSWLSNSLPQKVSSTTYDEYEIESGSASASLRRCHDAKSSERHNGCQQETCGAQWDVFRREDAPKLMEYLRRHSNEFVDSCSFQNHVVHPILDQSVFLDSVHKMRLKEEFEIEPWTFNQHVGEAVVVPAGCPYQIRNLKSCVNVVSHFMSPESIPDCLHLYDVLRLLPGDHVARVEMLEVKKLAIDSLSRAIKEIRQLTCTKTNDAI